MHETTLRSATLAMLLALAFPGAAAAQAGHDAHHAGARPAAEAAAEWATGTVRKVDEVAGKLTIAHGPLKALDMPPMTMAFRAADAAMLDRVAAGDEVRFTVARIGGVLTVTALEPAR